MGGESDEEEDKENNRRGIMGIDHDLLSHDGSGCCRGHAGVTNDFFEGTLNANTVGSQRFQVEAMICSQSGI